MQKPLEIIDTKGVELQNNGNLEIAPLPPANVVRKIICSCCMSEKELHCSILKLNLQFYKYVTQNALHSAYLFIIERSPFQPNSMNS